MGFRKGQMVKPNSYFGDKSLGRIDLSPGKIYRISGFRSIKGYEHIPGGVTGLLVVNDSGNLTLYDPSYFVSVGERCQKINQR